ncbi:MAG: MFS transporter [Phycisphaerales bacterium]
MGSFLPGSLPAMSRQSYRWEALSALFLPMAVACVEANVIAVIAKKAFDASPLAIATLAAAPALSNLSSVLWTRFIRGRDRVRAVNVMQVSLLVCVAAIALAPISALGQLMLVGSTLMARVLLTGIITARTDIWRNNYARGHRARVTGKLLTIAALTVAVTAGVLGAAMDLSEGARVTAFRVIYLGAAVVGLVGVWLFARIRWRTRSMSLSAERDPRAEYATAGARDMLRVLKNDKTYRSFMAAQFALGLPNLASIPIFILALEERFVPSYGESFLLTQIIPLLVPILTIPMWARLLDRMHIVRFRVYHSWFFVIANLLLGIGFSTESLWVIYVSRIVLGAAYGGGMLAWDLGHHDFARRDLATLYMGIHVTLTGVRGAIAPFLGTLLYAGALAVPAFAWGGWEFPGMSGPVPRLGEDSCSLLAAWAVVGALMFRRWAPVIGAAPRPKPGGH